MVALNPKSPASRSVSPVTQTFLTCKPRQTNYWIYLPSPNRSVLKADKAEQLGSRINRGEMLRWPHDDERSSFCAVIFMMQDHTADLARGFLQLMENRTLEENANQHQPCHRSSEASSLMTGSACSAANLQDNKSAKSIQQDPCFPSKLQQTPQRVHQQRFRGHVTV